VDDAFLGGTCVYTGTEGGAWLTQAQCQSSGRQWLPNGSNVPVVCALTGGSYTVRYANNTTQTWNWWARRSDGRYVRAAPLWANNNSDGNPIC
jgi:hypothetical protein